MSIKIQRNFLLIFTTNTEEIESQLRKVLSTFVVPFFPNHFTNSLCQIDKKFEISAMELNLMRCRWHFHHGHILLRCRQQISVESHRRLSFYCHETSLSINHRRQFASFLPHLRRPLHGCEHKIFFFCFRSLFAQIRSQLFLITRQRSAFNKMFMKLRHSLVVSANLNNLMNLVLLFSAALPRRLQFRSLRLSSFHFHQQLPRLSHNFQIINILLIHIRCFSARAYSAYSYKQHVEDSGFSSYSPSVE